MLNNHKLIVMTKNLAYLFIVIAVALLAFNLTQHHQIKKLKDIQANYDALTRNFMGLSKDYNQTLEKYKAIKEALNNSTKTLEELQKELDSLNQTNELVLDSLYRQINTIVNSMDTSEIENPNTIVDLKLILTD